MQPAQFSSEERIGLLVALALHVGVVAVMLLQPVRDDAMPIPERMTVSLASEVSLESTAPDPVADSRAAIAPTLADDPAPTTVEELPSEAQSDPEPTRPSVQPTTRPTTRATQTPRTPPSATPTPRGGSRIGSDFLPGSGGSTTTDDTRIPASQIGASAQASLRSAITRQLRPHWTAPQGVDAEKLVSVASWRLNPDGSLSGRPKCNTVSSSITPSNRPQANLHCERVIRAIQLAAPFDLPDQFYNGWKTISSWRFDRRL